MDDGADGIATNRNRAVSGPPRDSPLCRVDATVYTLAFDDFGWTELQREAASRDCTEEELLTDAIARFLAALAAEDRGNDGPPRVPQLARAPGWRRSNRIQVELTDEQAELLGREALRHGVSLPRLIEHAVIVELASP